MREERAGVGEQVPKAGGGRKGACLYDGRVIFIIHDLGSI